MLFGRAGADLLVGGAGSDTLVGGAGSDDIWGWDYWDYGDDHPKDPDTVRYDLGEGLNLNAYSGIYHGSVTFGGAPGETDTLHLIDNFWSGEGNDLIHGSSVANELRGGLGSDTLFGDDGDDTLFGQAGWDRFDGGNGLDTVVYSHQASGIPGRSRRRQGLAPRPEERIPSVDRKGNYRRQRQRHPHGQRRGQCARRGFFGSAG